MRRRNFRFLLAPAIIGSLIFAALFFITRLNAANALAPVSADNWNVDLKIKDSKTNTYGDSVSWNITADDLTVDEESEHRVITMLVSYTLENSPITYQPGDLELIIKNPLPAYNAYFNQRLLTNTAVGANSGNVTSHEWDDRSTKYSYSPNNNGNFYNSDFRLWNHNTIDAGSSVSGTIEISFDIVSLGQDKAPKYSDTSSKQINANNLTATLNNTIASNAVAFSFRRDFLHEWQPDTYTISATAQKINSTDGLAQNYDDYYWVYLQPSPQPSRLTNLCSESDEKIVNGHPVLGLSDRKMRVYVPENVVAYSADPEIGQVTQYNDGYYLMPESITSNVGCAKGPYSPVWFKIILGYPKNLYDGTQNSLTQSLHMELWGTPITKTEPIKLAEGNDTFSLTRFNFVYTGDAVTVSKYYDSFASYMPTPKAVTTEFIRDGSASAAFSNYLSVKQANEPYTLRLGDDILYYKDADSEDTQRISDNDYYFTAIFAAYTDNAYTQNGGKIPSENYKPKVYVRRRGQTNYTLYHTYQSLVTGGLNTDEGKARALVNFEENGDTDIVGWYIEIKNLSNTLSRYEAKTQVKFNSQTMPEKGTIYNFNYVTMQNPTTGAILNEPAESNYGSGITRNEIAPLDQQLYGHYMQRAVASLEYGPLDLGEIRHHTNTEVSSTPPSYDNSDSSFKGTLTLSPNAQDKTILQEIERLARSDWKGNIAGRMAESDWRKSADYYYLLPTGMVPSSSEREIVESFAAPNGSDYTNGLIRNPQTGEQLLVCTEEGADCDSSQKKAAYTSAIKERSTATIIRNWHNTSRYMIHVHIDLSDYPITLFNSSFFYSIGTYKANYFISLESYEENGSTYVVRAFADRQGFPAPTIDSYDPNSKLNAYATDNGTGYETADDDEIYASIVDFDDDGITNENFLASSATINLIYASSSSQDNFTTVRADVDNVYMSENALSSLGGDYDYKLRVRAGNNQSKNLIIYDNIETAYGENEHWQGTFRGVDTSFAESQTDADGNPITVKVYWSPSSTAGSLSEDSSWSEYNNSTDKSQVRSLAFEYLNQAGEPAVLPESNSTYVIIQMKAPNNNNLTSYAYNSFRSTWTNQLGNNPASIGSNTTTVYLDRLFDIHVKQIWIDDDNFYGLRPNNIDFDLKLNNSKIDDNSLATTNNEAQFDFTDMYVRDEGRHDVIRGETEHYTTTKEYDPDTHTYTFTSTLSDKYNITVKHVWVDDGNERELRPENVVYKLEQDDAEIDSRTLAAVDNAQDTFSDLNLVDKRSQSIPDVTVDHYKTIKTCNTVDNSNDILCTFTHTLQDNLDIHVVHIWKDNDNAYGFRPGSVEYTLKKGSATDQTATSSAEWKADFKNLHAPHENQYSVADVAIDHYSTTKSYDANTHTYTFTSTLSDKFKITIRHEWQNDNNNERHLRPENVPYAVKKTGSSNQTITLPATDTQDELANLNLLDFDKYSVPTDITVAHYSLDSANCETDTSHNISCTFVYSLEDDLDIHVKHVWVDNDNAYGYRPSSLDYELQKNGTTDQTKTSSTNWTADFTNLHRPDENQYGMPDMTIAHYSTVKTYDSATHTYTYTSTLSDTFKITVKHNWVDDNNERGLRPENVAYTITETGAANRTITLASTNAQDSIANLNLLDADKFGIEDVTVDHYSTSKSCTTNATTHDITCTFTHTLQDNLDIHIVHIWEDRDNAYGFRPNSLTYTLQKSGTTDQTATSNANWTADFTNLHMPDEAKYSVPDMTVEHYTTTKDYDASTHTYTFTSRLSDKFSIIVKHIWIDEDNIRDLRPTSVIYDLVKNSDTSDTLELGPTDTQDSFDELDLIDEPRYNVPDVTVEHYSTTKEYDATTRTYTFTHTLEDDLDIHVKHIWVDNDNTYGYRPDSVSYTLTKNSATDQTAASSSDWAADFTNLHRPDEAQYSVEDVTVEHYETTKEYDSNTHTYTFTSTLSDNFNIIVKQVWDDEDNIRDLRPENITYLLNKEDTEIDSTTLQPIDTQDKFDGLPLLDKEKYNIPDVEIEHYKTTKTCEEVSGTQNVICTFVHKLQDNLDIHIVQIWDDDNNADGIRPNEVGYSLKRDDEAIGSTTTSPDSDWLSEFLNLYAPAKQSYSVEIEDIEDYTTTVEFDAETMTFTFTSSHHSVKEEPSDPDEPEDPSSSDKDKTTDNTPDNTPNTEYFNPFIPLISILGLGATGAAIAIRKRR